MEVVELKIELGIGCRDLWASGYDKDGRKVYDTENFNYRDNHQNATDGLAKKLGEDLGINLPKHWGLSLLGDTSSQYLNIERYGKDIELRKNVINNHWFLSPSEEPMQRGAHKC